MRHHKAHRTFGRPRNQRKALLHSLAYALLTHEKIHTTEAKAKELRPYIEKIVTRSKMNSLSNRRLFEREFPGKPQLVSKLFATIGPRYKDRRGGYTRITKLSRHADDGRKTAQIEFV